MTPKEKAKELYDKYEFVYIQNYTSKHEVKECALIAVDEILLTLSNFQSLFSVIGNILLDLIKYWQEVKQEIEKL
jgi:hypothetical protein